MASSIQGGAPNHHQAQRDRPSGREEERVRGANGWAQTDRVHTVPTRGPGPHQSLSHRYPSHISSGYGARGRLWGGGPVSARPPWGPVPLPAGPCDLSFAIPHGPPFESQMTPHPAPPRSGWRATGHRRARSARAPRIASPPRKYIGEPAEHPFNLHHESRRASRDAPRALLAPSGFCHSRPPSLGRRTVFS